MVLQCLLLVAHVAFAAPPAKTAKPAKVARPAPEETLAVMLATVRQAHAAQMREAVVGGAEELRDAMASGTGASKKRLADRLPGMARDPYDICRTWAACREAPVSLHVEENALADDAFLALARPWFRLQEARGKGVDVSFDPGVGVQLKLEDMPARPVVILSASPAPTGGFDVAVEDGAEAAKTYAAARATLTAPK